MKKRVNKINYQEEFDFYQMIKSKITKKEKNLNKFIKNNSKVYKYLDKFKGFYNDELISEIEFARQRKTIKKMIADYEKNIKRQENAIEDMKDYVYEFESLFKIHKGLWVIHTSKSQLLQTPQKMQRI